MKVGDIVPVVKCHDVRAAERFYVSVLGFRKDWEHADSPEGPWYLGLSLDGHCLHLSSFAGDGAFGSAVYLHVDGDVDALFAKFRAAGLARVDFEPTTQTWGRREFQVRDPDNNTLRFGAVARPGGVGAPHSLPEGTSAP